MRMAGWTPGSALSSTISPSLCGSTGLALTITCSASGARRLAASSKNSAVSMLRHERTRSSFPPVGKKMISASWLCVSPVSEGGGDQAAPGRLPLGDPPFRLLLHLPEVGGEVRVVGGIGGQRSASFAQGRGTHRERDLVHRHACPRCREEQRHHQMVLQM